MCATHVRQGTSWGIDKGFCIPVPHIVYAYYSLAIAANTIGKWPWGESDTRACRGVVVTVCRIQQDVCRDGQLHAV